MTKQEAETQAIASLPLAESTHRKTLAGQLRGMAPTIQEMTL